jgi:ketosteroid isomerase-like protein
MVERRAIDQVRQRELASLSDSSQALSSIFSNDIVAMPPDEDALIGRDKVDVWFKQLQKEYVVAARYPESKITVAGDWAIERYAGELTLTPRKGGKAVQDKFKGIHIYHRQPDGSWRITDDIWNSNAPPPAPGKSR